MARMISGKSLLAGAAWLIAALAACGSVPAAPSAIPFEQGAPAAVPALAIGLAAAPATLDPLEASDEASQVVLGHVYEGLVAYAPGTTAIVPALALSWDVAPDSLAWTFHLRPHVRFGDGSALTAEAIRRNVERWMRHASAAPQPGRFWVAEAPDEATLILRLSQPDGALLSKLALIRHAIVNPAVFDSPGQLAQTRGSGGTGPFLLKDRAADGSIRLTRNLEHWDAPATVDELLFRPLPDPAARLRALQAGEVQVIDRPDPGDYGAIRADPALRLELAPGLNIVYLGFNQAHSPWGARICRLAVAHALGEDPKEDYVEDFFPGDAEQSFSLQPPALWSYSTSTWDADDPEEARGAWAQCLRAAASLGATLPATISLAIPPAPLPELPDPRGLGDAIVADLARAGIAVRLVPAATEAEWRSLIAAGRADLFLAELSGADGDPDSFLCALFCGATAAFNGDGHGRALAPDAELAALLAYARAVSAPERRAELYGYAHARVLDTIPAIPLASRRHAWAVRAPLRGVAFGPSAPRFLGVSLAGN